MKERYGIIYLIQCTANGKRYVGQTKNSMKERYSGLTEVGLRLHTNKLIKEDIDKFGFDSFIFYKELDVAYSKEELNELEVYWIDYYNSANPLLGYNLTLGGSGATGRETSEETRNKIRNNTIKQWERQGESKRKEFSERMSGENNPMYGKIGRLSPSYGIHGKDKTLSKPIKCIEDDLEFESIQDAAWYYGIDRAQVSKCVNGSIKSCGKRSCGRELHFTFVVKED